MWESREGIGLAFGPVAPNADVSDAVKLATNNEIGHILLFREEEQLELAWDGSFAVISYAEDENSGRKCGVTKKSSKRTKKMRDEDLVGYACPCCGVGLGDFEAESHIVKDVGIEVFIDFIKNDRLPINCSEGPLSWMDAKIC